MSHNTYHTPMNALASVTTPETGIAETPIEEIDISMQGLYAYLREHCQFQVEPLYSCGGHAVGSGDSFSIPYLMLSVSMEGLPLVLKAHSRAHELVTLSKVLQENQHWAIEHHYRSTEEPSPVWAFRAVGTFTDRDTQEMTRILHQAFIDARKAMKATTLNDVLKEARDGGGLAAM